MSWLLHFSSSFLLMWKAADDIVQVLESMPLDSIDLKIGIKILSSSLPHNTLKKVIQLQF